MLLARQITHPNVCRIHEFDDHRTVDGEGRETRVYFLTMELLRGQTLADRVRRGPLAPGEALAIVSQLASGLGAAHALGIIHRDFKSANVILVPAEDPSKPPRVVVTDFGLARAIRATADAGLAPLSEIVRDRGYAGLHGPGAARGPDAHPGRRHLHRDIGLPNDEPTKAVFEFLNGLLKGR